MTTKTRAPVKRIETPAKLPRSYGLMPVGKTTFISPSPYAMAQLYVTPEAEKYRMLAEWLVDRRKSLEKALSPNELSPMLFYEPPELQEAIAKAVQKEKESRKFLEMDPDVVITEATWKYNVLRGKVASRRPADGDVMEGWLAEVRTPSFNPEFGIDYEQVSCQCPGYIHCKEKGAEVFEFHPAALLAKANAEYPGLEGGVIRFERPSKPPYIPFAFDRLTLAEILVLRYLLRKKYFDIDKLLLERPETYEVLFQERMGDGKLTFEVLPQLSGKTTTKDLDYWGAVDYIERQAYWLLTSGGFKPQGLSTVEFKGSEWETVCQNFQNGDRMVRLLFHPQRRFPPLLQYRKFTGSGFEGFSYPASNGHPVSYLGQEFESIDDRTRRRTKTRIIIPHSPMTVPELPELAPLRRPIIGNLRSEYADGIRRYAQTGDEEKSALLRRVGLDRV